MNEILLAIIGLGGTGLGYLFALRKNRAEADGAEIDNTAKIIRIWEELAAKLKAEMEELRAENDSLKIQLDALRASDQLQRAEIAKLHEELNDVRAENEKLRARLP